jgi:hypothetical protein
MKPAGCDREREVLVAVLERQWEQCDHDELRAHAAACPACSEILSIAELMAGDRDVSLREVRVPAAGQIWWRAAIRAQADAARAARRPMLWLQGIAGACILGAGAALVGVAWRSIREAAVWAWAFFPIPQDLQLGGIGPALVETFLPAIVLSLLAAAFLILAPLAVYFALSDE